MSLQVRGGLLKLELLEKGNSCPCEQQHGSAKSKSSLLTCKAFKSPLNFERGVLSL
jgi:hypothetical protein